MAAPRILVFAGSARSGSVNKKFAAHAADVVRARGADVTHIDLNDYPAPIYHGDDEAAQGVPDKMRELKALIRQHDGLLISTPEYNGHPPPLLINALDWVSRAEEDDPADAFNGKVAAIMAASPGGLGGARVVPRMRMFLTDLGVMTVPGHASLPGAFQGFDADGKLTNERAASQVDSLVDKLIAVLGGV